VLSTGLAPLAAQETTGSIGGTVVDASGAAIPGAKVEITGDTVTRAIALTTNAAGSYIASQLSPGTYDVTVTAQGFSVTKKTAVLVVLGKNSRVDFKLEVGQLSESITISADSAMVDTASSSTAINVDKSFFDVIPKGRSFGDLVNVAPGVRSETKSGQYQVDGASGAENTFYLDGMEVTNVYGGQLGSSSSVPVEMVEQVQVKNGVMDAQYGGAMGGVVNAVLKSGTNAYHGQAGFYFNNDGMQARYRPNLRLNPFDENIQEYQQYRMDNYSTWNPVFDVGGPILKDKLFFFAGFMPTQTNTTRDVAFTDGTQSSFSQHSFQHYSVGKLDYVATSKLRFNGSFIYSPDYNRGILPARGTAEYPSTDDSSAPWADEGNYHAATTVAFGADYVATNKLIFSFRGGIKRNNTNTNYGIPNTTAIYYSGDSTTLPPPDLQAPNGWISAAVGSTPYDIYQRRNWNADATYIFNWMGQHSLKGGWSMNQLSNDVSSLTYPNGYYRYYWGLEYACITSQCSGRNSGPYGYYRYRLLGTFGKASSSNQGIYVQDNWRANRHVNFNVGFRFEREFLPSFGTEATAAAPPIKFSWGQKFSPRLGVAFDPKGDGKQRIYASWGQFYDVMKYSMPRGSFGGDVWQEWYYSLDDPNLVNTLQGLPADPFNMPGTFYEMVNWRIAANDPSTHRVDPDLKPVKQQMFDVGYEYSLNPTMVLSARYTNRRLSRTVEDTGYMGVDGETYLIANPGEGITTGQTWTDLWQGDTGIPSWTKPKRHYDAIEARVDKRFSRNYQFVASYTWSRLWGNYSGLASSDENGRDDPSVERYYDMPWQYADQAGKTAEGRLATDRPHTIKFFGAYVLNSKLGASTFAPNIQLYSGTPLSSEVAVISSTTAMPYGRGDLGRTPFYSNFDFNFMHDFMPFKNNEAARIRFELSIFNLFNQSTVTNHSINLQHPSDGQIQFDTYSDFFKGWNARDLMTAQGMRIDPQYNLANGFQAPRSLRIQVAFMF
jgi:hypothetical protein